MSSSYWYFLNREKFAVCFALIVTLTNTTRNERKWIFSTINDGNVHKADILVARDCVTRNWYLFLRPTNNYRLLYGMSVFTVLQSALVILNTSANQKMFDDWEKRQNGSQCIRCAVVGNGGILNGSKKGREIDQNDYVFRWDNIGALLFWETWCSAGLKSDKPLCISINPSQLRLESDNKRLSLEMKWYKKCNLNYSKQKISQNS